jgi:hypothetical protein
MPVTIGRRELIAALGGAAVAWSLTARAQQLVRKTPVIGIIDDAPVWDHFRKELRDLGYVDGRNIEIHAYTSREQFVGRGDKAVRAQSIRLENEKYLASLAQNQNFRSDG